MSICHATFDSVRNAKDRHGTHTCDLPDRHYEWHHCPLCNARWDGRRVISRTPSVAEQAEVLAEMAAEADGDVNR